MTENQDPTEENQVSPMVNFDDFRKVLVKEKDLNALIAENKDLKSDLREALNAGKEVFQMLGSPEKINIASIAMMVPKIMANKGKFEPLIKLFEKYQYLTLQNQENAV